MDKLSNYSKKFGFKFPKVYKDFYYACDLGLPKNLIGTDLINNSAELKEFAIELLHENLISPILDNNDFVFMMHQGYMFWYFKADGNENPNVYGFSEVDKKIKDCGQLKIFLQDLVS